MRAFYFYIFIIINSFIIFACVPEPPNNNPTRLWPLKAEITEDETTLTFSWDDEPNARRYEVRVWQDSIVTGTLVTVEFGTHGTTLTSYTVDKSIFIGISGYINFSVISIGKKNFTNSDPAIRRWHRDMLRLATPVNLNFDYSKGILTWGAVSGAEDYLVNCYLRTNPNTSPVDVLELSVEAINNSCNFSEYKHITPLVFEIQARNTNPDVYNSYFTNKFPFYILLDSPTGLVFNGDIIFPSLSWNAVENAVSYDVSCRYRALNGNNVQSETFRTNNLSYLFAPFYLDINEITFYVRANSAQNSGYASSNYTNLIWNR